MRFYPIVPVANSTIKPASFVEIFPVANSTVKPAQSSFVENPKGASGSGVSGSKINGLLADLWGVAEDALLGAGGKLM